MDLWVATIEFDIAISLNSRGYSGTGLATDALKQRRGVAVMEARRQQFALRGAAVATLLAILFLQLLAVNVKSSMSWDEGHHLFFRHVVEIAVDGVLQARCGRGEFDGFLAAHSAQQCVDQTS